MRTFTSVFLASAPEKMFAEGSAPTSSKTTPVVERVSQDELELTYMTNPTVFNSINKTVQMIMAADHPIVAKNPKVQAYFDKFVATLGNAGSDATWEEILTDIVKHQCMYGRSFVENVFNKRGNRIVDWVIIDPKKMDYAKDSLNRIVMDQYGNPVGYIEVIPLQDSTGMSMNQIPKVMAEKGVVAPSGGRAIFLYPKQVAHIKLYTVGDGFYGIGLIEPIYKTSLRKLNIEEAHANAVYRHGYPIVWASLGDSNHEPTPQQIENMSKKLKDINSRTEITTPYYYQLQVLESKNSDKIKEHLDYFREQEIAGLGIPQPFATGGANGASFSTLGNQSAMFQLALNDIAKKTAAAIEKYMFKPVCDLEGFTEVPKLKWDIVGIDELDQKANRLMKYAQAGLVLPDEKTIQFIKKVEKLE
jgi:hypothetical protein